MKGTIVFSSHSTLLSLQLWEDPKYLQLSTHSHPQPPPLIEANKGDTHSPSTSITPKSKHILIGIDYLVYRYGRDPPGCPRLSPLDQDQRSTWSRPQKAWLRRPRGRNLRRLGRDDRDHSNMTDCWPVPWWFDRGPTPITVNAQTKISEVNLSLRIR